MAEELNDERSVTARVPLQLWIRLEECRHIISKTTGRRVSTKRIVVEALERFLDIMEKKLVADGKEH